jgi:hypothetical protein
MEARPELVEVHAHLLESDQIFSSWHANVFRASRTTGSHYFQPRGTQCG